MASTRAKTILMHVSCLAFAACAAARATSLPVIHPEQWPALQGHVLIRPDIERMVDELLGRMSLEEKIGQMVQADTASITPAELQTYRLGSILAGGLSAPGNDIHASPRAWLDMVQSYQHAATTGGTSRHQPIPILFGIDAVHGNAKIPGATIFPHNVGLGAAHDPDLMQRIGAATAQEVAVTGVDWAFAPTIAVVRDPRWGRAYESYSDEPSLVAAYAASMVTGLQGRLGTADALSPQHVLAAAKHFVGDGGTTDGRDQGDNAAAESVLRDVDAAGYPSAIQAGVATIMASYNTWHGVRMHANAALLTGILKQRWNFDGFVIGDWNAVEEIPGCTKFSCPAAVNAGIDMVMAPDSWKQMYTNLLHQARDGTIPAARIDDAVRRILRVKALDGLLGAKTDHEPSIAGNFNVLGSVAHRALAREAVRKSLVLLKNEQAVLPIDRHRRVLVVGAAADDIGQQCGGWTLDWQGAHNSNAAILGATSIFAGIRSVVESSGGTASFSADGAFTQRPDVAIVVYGEHPYAEFEGDRENLQLGDADHVRTILTRLHDQGVPVVSVLLSGRPLWVDRELNLSQAFVAAWLPGSEGEGVADMLFRGQDGAIPDFSGRLGFPWPETAMPVMYVTPDHTVGALFPHGYGLDLHHAVHVGELPEDPHVSPDRNTHDSFFASGHVVAPWSIYVSDALSEVRMIRGAQSSPGDSVESRLDGDAVEARWTGKEQGVWRIGSRPIDLSEAAAEGRALSVTYRLAHAPASLELGQRCGKDCGAWFDVTASLRTGGWQTLTVPLSCFAAHGADLRHIDVPFALRSDATNAISIDNVSLTQERVTSPCPTS